MNETMIIVSRGMMREIAAAKQVSRRTVYSALRGITRSELSREIREYAISYGGVEVPERPRRR